MTTTQLRVSRGQEIGEFPRFSDGVIGADVRLIADKSLKKSELLALLRQAKDRVLQMNIPNQ